MFGYGDRGRDDNRTQGSTVASSSSTTGTGATDAGSTTGTTDQKDTNLNSSFSGTY